MTIRASHHCTGETLVCAGCRRPTALELIDGKDDGTGDFSIMHCPDCYGPGWCPVAEHFVVRTGRDRLAFLAGQVRLKVTLTVLNVRMAAAQGFPRSLSGFRRQRARGI